MTLLIVFLLVCLVLGFDGPRNVFENTIKAVVFYGFLIFLGLALGETFGWWIIPILILFFIVFKTAQSRLKHNNTTP